MAITMPIEYLIHMLRSKVPACTDSVLALELFNVIDEFFRRTSVWKYATTIELDPDIQEYDVGVPEGAVIVRLMGLTRDGTPVQPASSGGTVFSSLGELDAASLYPDGDASFVPASSDLSGGLFTYSMFRPTYISFTSPPPAGMAGVTLDAVFALSLAPAAIEDVPGDWPLEDWMPDMFFQNWQDGALARLYAMPAKPWTQAQLAVAHGKRWRAALGYRKQEAEKGFVYNQPKKPLFPRGGWI